jgi:hypothetical protein
MKYLLYILFFILIIIFVAYVNSKSKESFTPVVNSFCRPIIRETRLAAEGFYDKTTNSINESNRSFNNFFARLGLK